MNLFIIIVGGLLVNNYIMTRFLGICSFLGVSQKIETATGMGLAVIFVMTLSSIITYIINEYALVPLSLQYMQTLVFIVVIAALVQLVEMVLKNYIPLLYNALGIYLPLITTNCAVFGVALLNVTEGYNLIQSTVNGFACGAGYTLSIVMLAGIRERFAVSDYPKWMDGFPGTLITASLMSVAFMGFAGLVQ